MSKQLAKFVLFKKLDFVAYYKKKTFRHNFRTLRHPMNHMNRVGYAPNFMLHNC